MLSSVLYRFTAAAHPIGEIRRRRDEAYCIVCCMAIILGDFVSILSV